MDVVPIKCSGLNCWTRKRMLDEETNEFCSTVNELLGRWHTNFSGFKETVTVDTYWWCLCKKSQNCERNELFSIFKFNQYSVPFGSVLFGHEYWQLFSGFSVLNFWSWIIWLLCCLTWKVTWFKQFKLRFNGSLLSLHYVGDSTLVLFGLALVPQTR